MASGGACGTPLKASGKAVGVKKKKTAAPKNATQKPKPSAKSPSKRKQPSKLVSEDGLAPLKRKVPDYYSGVRFRVVRREYGFASRVKIRRWFKGLVQRYVNSSRGRQEFYEESLCWMVPCHEIRFVLAPIKGEAA